MLAKTVIKVLPWIVIALLVVLTPLFVKMCESVPAVQFTPDPITIKITAPKEIRTHIPKGQDSLKIVALLQEIDLLRSELKARGVSRVIVYDTILPVYGATDDRVDSIHIECDEISRTAKADIRFAERSIPIPARRTLSAFFVQGMIGYDFTSIVPRAIGGVRISPTEYLDFIAQVQTIIKPAGIIVIPEAGVRVEF